MAALATLICATFLPACFANVIPYAQFAAVPQPSGLSSTNPNHGPAPSELFQFHDWLTEDYTLYWNFNDTHITLEMVVKTNGWVGFGISPNGAMKSSDVIIGWVKDGQVHFADRHAEGHFLPAKDSSQDWTLLMGQEVGEYTVLKVVRLLDTCDDEDVAVLPGTTRVIYAYSPNDPPTDDAVRYHGTTRGAKSILLLDPPTNEQQESALPSDVKVLEFRNRNVSVPSTDTTYHCTLWKLPDLGGKHHMIRFEPIIQRGHELLLHHAVLYYCLGSLDESIAFPTSFSCYPNPPRQAYQCYQILIAWAIGGKAFNYPTHTGYPFGGAGDPGYFMMETHYDNPNMRADYVDNSGLRVYLTTQLRQHDAGIFLVGVNVDAYQIIPPYEKSFMSTGYCEESCLAEGLGDQEMHVFANLLHAHLLGVKLRTRHFRNGTELPPIQEDNNYDFDYQETRFLNTERIIKKGDSLLVECEYDSTQRTTVTHGGLSSRQEMCESFLMYYPRSQHSYCASRLLYKIPEQFSGRDVMDIVHHLDWTDPKVHAGFMQAVSESEHVQICYGKKEMKSHLRVFPRPKIDSTYQKPNVCPTV
ncbi:DBH-like monooxygenase protein 1 [Plakobranchus ocellatus]|uniref:DBH-like monooxygenase protein 1 n=1 Tax=Plakobranchus ocellatus TaxID=259542 RepID=A0AAV4DXG7_9GAST|nr:DBH-like monooxygenase protein 1 [Plakobranchus ocellatus]